MMMPMTPIALFVILLQLLASSFAFTAPSSRFHSPNIIGRNGERRGASSGVTRAAGRLSMALEPEGRRETLTTTTREGDGSSPPSFPRWGAST